MTAKRSTTKRKPAAGADPDPEAIQLKRIAKALSGLGGVADSIDSIAHSLARIATFLESDQRVPFIAGSLAQIAASLEVWIEIGGVRAQPEVE